MLGTDRQARTFVSSASQSRRIFMKLLFLQDFHMDAQGGGTYILRRMCGFAPEFGVEYQFVYDLNGEGPYPSSDYPSTAIRTRRRQYRFGLGRLVGLATILGWDASARQQIRRAIDAFEPDALHIVAHGVSFPLMAREALRTGLPVYLSVHDLWPETVRPYIPRRWAHGLFGRIARKAEKLFVVSDEMGEYLEEQYGLNNWAVVHDGSDESPSAQP
ncbi:MAG: hypothetical protein KatS3mg030_508 [Saprospiraceae bacterium]|nr:MAG: hypothetical protein KatS3mg030_508 [Saprospiraceae bacterium]